MGHGWVAALDSNIVKLLRVCAPAVLQREGEVGHVCVLQAIPEQPSIQLLHAPWVGRNHVYNVVPFTC